MLISEGEGGWAVYGMSLYQYNASTHTDSRLRTTFACNRMTTVFAN